MNPVAACAAQLRGDANILRRYGDERLPSVLESIADAIEEAMCSAMEETLSLREAARASGYSEDHLGRLVREGKIPNRGRPHRPLIRRADLPIKPGFLPTGQVRQQLLGGSPRQIVDAVVNADR